MKILPILYRAVLALFLAKALGFAPLSAAAAGGGPAEPGGLDANDDLVRSRHRVGGDLDTEIPGLTKDCGSHGENRRDLTGP